MACKKNGRANRGTKAPRPAAPQKGAKKKVKKITRSVAARKAKRATQLQQRVPKSTLFMKALDNIPSGYELLLQDASGFVEINGPAEEEGCEKKQCRCLSLGHSSCKKHPSCEKVRTGHFIVGKTQRRAVWVPKVLVDKGVIKVKEDAKFQKNWKNFMNGKPL